MVVTPNEATGKRVAARAEAWGERLGRSLARARRRIETSRQSIEPPRQTEEGGAAQRPAGDGQLINRADDLVTRFGRGFTAYATVLTDRVRRGVARIREEAEDIAAEAAHLRETRAAAEPQLDQSQRGEAEPAA